MKRGHLRIYVGFAAGVGKTFAMLGEGHRRRDRGTDVVIGFVESHGRPMTEDAIGELLEMGGASLFFVSLVVHAHAYRPAHELEPGRRGNLALLAELIHRLDPIKLAIGVAVAVVVLGVMGAVSHSVDYMRVFDVNKEQTTNSRKDHDAYIKKNKAQLWIQHDMVQFAK